MKPHICSICQNEMDEVEGEDWGIGLDGKPEKTTGIIRSCPKHGREEEIEDALHLSEPRP